MNATIVVTVDEARVVMHVAGLRAHDDPGSDWNPTPAEYVAEVLGRLCDDELPVATMFGPGFEFRVGDDARTASWIADEIIGALAEFPRIDVPQDESVFHAFREKLVATARRALAESREPE